MERLARRTGLKDIFRATVIGGTLSLSPFAAHMASAAQDASLTHTHAPRDYIITATGMCTSNDARNLEEGVGRIFRREIGQLPVPPRDDIGSATIDKGNGVVTYSTESGTYRGASFHIKNAEYRSASINITAYGNSNGTLNYMTESGVMVMKNGSTCGVNAQFPIPTGQHKPSRAVHPKHITQQLGQCGSSPAINIETSIVNILGRGIYEAGSLPFTLAPSSTSTVQAKVEGRELTLTHGKTYYGTPLSFKSKINGSKDQAASMTLYVGTNSSGNVVRILEKGNITVNGQECAVNITYPYPIPGNSTLHAIEETSLVAGGVGLVWLVLRIKKKK